MKKIRMSKKISSGIIAVLMTLTVLGGQTSQVYADEYVSETTETVLSPFTWMILGEQATPLINQLHRMMILQ